MSDALRNNLRTLAVVALVVTPALAFKAWKTYRSHQEREQRCVVDPCGCDERTGAVPALVTLKERQDREFAALLREQARAKEIRDHQRRLAEIDRVQEYPVHDLNEGLATIHAEIDAMGGLRKRHEAEFRAECEPILGPARATAASTAPR